MKERLGQAIDRALDHQTRGTVSVGRDERSAEVDVVQTGPLGVRLKRLAVTAPRGSLEDSAESLPDRLRALPERVVPMEVDPVLGGATLRTDPGEMRDREFFEVEVRGNEVTVERFRVGDGGRRAVDFDVTRKQLGRLIDDLDE